MCTRVGWSSAETHRTGRLTGWISGVAGGGQHWTDGIFGPGSSGKRRLDDECVLSQMSEQALHRSAIRRGSSARRLDSRPRRGRICRRRAVPPALGVCGGCDRAGQGIYGWRMESPLRLQYSGQKNASTETVEAISFIQRERPSTFN